MSRARTALLVALAAVAALTACARLSGGLPRSALAARERLDPPPVVDEVRLAVFGDWGSDNARQWTLIDRLEETAPGLGGLHGGLLLGDNFYPSGVKSVDDPRWEAVFARPFDTVHLGRLTWHAVLGNHDYRGDEEAQIAYTDRSARRWSMPAHYYRVDFGPEDGDPLLTVLAVDTNRRFEGWDAQLAWLDGELAALAAEPWPTVVIGHHPVVSYSRHGKGGGEVPRLGELLARHRPAAYLAGHDHNQQLIDVDGVLHAVLGAGVRSLYGTRMGEGSLLAAEERGFGILRASAAGLALEIHDLDGRLLYEWRQGAEARDARRGPVRTGSLSPGWRAESPGLPAPTRHPGGIAAR